MVVIPPNIHLFVVLEDVSVSLIQRDGLYRSIQLNPATLLLTILMKSVDPILIRYNSGKFVIKVYINRVFILSLEILLQGSIFKQPFALIMMGSQDIIIPNVHLECIFIVERNSLIDLPLRTTLLALTVLTHQFLRVKFHLSSYSFRVKLNSLHCARISI